MKKITLLLLTLALFVACSNEDEDRLTTKNSFINTEDVTFVYKGVTYSSPVYYENDSILVFKDIEVGKIFGEINKLPNVAVLITRNSPDEYFDDFDSLQKVLDLRSNEDSNAVPQLRASTSTDISNISCEIKMYDKANYSGRMTPILLWPFPDSTKGRYSDHYNGISDLRTLNFNDMLTSITIKASDPYYIGLTVTFFQDPDYTGKSWTHLDFNTFNEPDFGKYRCTQPSLWHHSKDWNEIISSIQIKWKINKSDTKTDSRPSGSSSRPPGSSGGRA